MASAGAEDEPQRIPTRADARGHGDGEPVLSRTACPNGNQRRHIAAMENRDDGRGLRQRDVEVDPSERTAASRRDAGDGVAESFRGCAAGARSRCRRSLLRVRRGAARRRWLCRRRSGRRRPRCRRQRHGDRRDRRRRDRRAGQRQDDAVVGRGRRRGRHRPGERSRSEHQGKRAGRANRVAEAGGWAEGPHRRGPSDEARPASHATSTPVCQPAPQPVSKRSLVGVSKENSGLQRISAQSC